MKIYKISQVAKELTEEMKQMEEMKKNLDPTEMKEFEKYMEEQMKNLTPEQRKDVEMLKNEQQKNPNLPGTQNNLTMPTTQKLQQKPQDKYESQPSNLSKEQRGIFNGVDTLIKSKFPEMKPAMRDPKGKTTMYDLFNTLTDGNKAELSKHLNQMKPSLNKFKSNEDTNEKRKQLERDTKPK